MCFAVCCCCRQMFGWYWSHQEHHITTEDTCWVCFSTHPRRFTHRWFETSSAASRIQPIAKMQNHEGCRWTFSSSGWSAQRFMFMLGIQKYFYHLFHIMIIPWNFFCFFVFTRWYAPVYIILVSCHRVHQWRLHSNINAVAGQYRFYQSVMFPWQPAWNR